MVIINKQQLFVVWSLQTAVEIEVELHASLAEADD